MIGKLFSGLFLVLSLAISVGIGWQYTRVDIDAKSLPVAPAKIIVDGIVLDRAAMAERISKAYKLQEQEDLAAALRLLLPLAEQGNARAQFNVGRLYDADGVNAMPTGRGQIGGAEEDFANAIKWYKAAALQGHARAQASLGNLYLLGVSGMRERGVDVDEGLKWLHLSAETKEVDAFRSLGEYYRGYGGVPLDFAQSAKWFTEAAKQGDQSALIHLGAYYARGQGVEVDEVQSYVYYYIVGFKKGTGDGLSSAELAEVERRVKAWRAQYPGVPVRKEE